jgi:ATP/ADP translocase
MTFGERVVGALKLDANTFEDIERDPAAMGQAVGIIALASLASNLGQIWRLGFGVMLIGVCASLVGYVLWAVIVWVAGTKLMPDPATKADFAETFRTIAFAAAPGLLGVVTIIPLLGWLLLLVLTPIMLLWSIAAMVIAVRQVLDYTDTFKAVIVVLIGFAVYLAFRATIAMLALGAAIMGGLFGR